MSSKFSPHDSLQSAEIELCSLGRVLIVSFVEETEGSLVSRRNNYSSTRIVLPSQSRCCPPKIHFHVPAQLDCHPRPLQLVVGSDVLAILK